MFSDLVVLYLFLGGTGAGALVALSSVEAIRAIFRLTGRREAVPWVAEVVCLPGQFFSAAWPIAWVCVSAAILCLALDVGRPERTFALLVHPQLTAMTIGAYSLIAAFLCSGIFALASMLDGVSMRPKARLVAACVGIVSGVVAALYTGFLLNASAAVLLWQSALLPVLFLLSSLSCGMAVLLASLAFVRSRRPIEEQACLLAHIDSGLIVAEAIALTVFLVQDAVVLGAGDSVAALVFGELSSAFWIGLVVIGLGMPFAVERFVPARNFRPQLLWAAACVLIGGVTLRWLIVSAAAYDVTQSADMLYGFAMSASWAGAL